jgi:hypothetical protein
MEWIVQLIGDASDLAALAHSLTGSDIKVSRDDQNYVLSSDRFAPTDDPAAVRKKAEDIVTILSGASRLALDATQSLRVANLYRVREDGSRELFFFPAPVVFRIRMGLITTRITHPDGTVEERHPADPVKHWASLALSNDHVARVLRIVSTDKLDYVNLYRIIEIVAEDVGGIDSIVSNGWGTKASINLFKHTANHPGAAAIQARHGASKGMPPPKPMPISEARSLVNSIIHAWLRAKTSE